MSTNLKKAELEVLLTEKNITLSKLEQEVKELKSELAKKSHLAEAIEAKDEKIARLTKDFLNLQKESVSLAKYNTEVANFKETIKEYDKKVALLATEKAEAIAKAKETATAKAKEAAESTIVLLESELAALKANKNAIAPEYVAKLEVDNNILVNSLNQYMFSFRRFLTSQKASLENMVELEALISGILKEKREGMNKK